MARARSGDAAELDWEIARDARTLCGIGHDDGADRSFHDAGGHDLRRLGGPAVAGHPQVPELLAGVRGSSAMEAQLKAMQGKSVKAADIATAEKEGFFTGRFALNPFSGERVPIWVANFVLAEYGTGAVMCGAGARSARLRVCGKISSAGEDRDTAVGGPPLRPDRMNEASTEYGRLVDSGPYTGLTSEQAIEKMTADAAAKKFRQGRNDVPAEGLGHFAAALLGHANPGGLLREGRHRAACRTISCRCGCLKMWR